jgi:hypothetical protein
MCVLVERPHHSPNEAWSLGGPDWLHYVQHLGDWSLGKSPSLIGLAGNNFVTRGAVAHPVTLKYAILE